MKRGKRAVAHLTIFSHNTLQNKPLVFPDKSDNVAWCCCARALGYCCAEEWHGMLGSLNRLLVTGGRGAIYSLVVNSN
jgi:hypothetical protein